MKKQICMLLIGIIFLYGCSSNLNQGVDGEILANTVVKNTDEQNNNLKLLAGTKSLYYRFDKANFEKSLEQGKVIFLDFHADWCPICLREKPGILAAFNELDNDDVVGYQVHYNDGQTTEDDKEMAKKYGITYQHTKVIIGKDSKVVLKSLEVFSKERVINEINKAIAG